MHQADFLQVLEAKILCLKRGYENHSVRDGELYDPRFGSLRFNFFVVPKEELPEISFLVVPLVCPDSSLYRISDEVPPEFRRFAIAHCYVEYEKIGFKVHNRCLSATVSEIGLVPDEHKIKYLEMRIDALNSLIEKGPYFFPKQVDPLEVHRLKGSRVILEDFLKGYKNGSRSSLFSSP